MGINFFKKTIFFLISSFLISFFVFNNIVYAGTITANENVSISAVVGEVVTVTPGGGGGFVLPKTAVRFVGQAYPGALVTLLKQGEKKITVTANSAGEFSITLEESYNNNILYSLFAEDVFHNRSLLLNYPIAVQVGFVTELSGIRFAPTIVIDKSQVRFGDYLTVNGSALPQKELEVKIKGIQDRTFTLTSNRDGSYKIVVPMGALPRGEYNVFINYKDDLRTSKLVKFLIGDTNIFFTENLSDIPGDCNADKVINLVDFSVLAFWYGKPNPPKCVDTNADNIINLVDFSILAFYWTG